MGAPLSKTRAHTHRHTSSCICTYIQRTHMCTGTHARAHPGTHTLVQRDACGHSTRIHRDVHACTRMDTHTHTHTHTSGVTGHTREIGLQGGEGLARGEAGSRRASWQRDSLPASRGGPGVPVGWGGTRPPIPTSQAWEAGAVAGLLQL